MAREKEKVNFLSGANALFLEQMYAAYMQNPAGVDPSWASFFDTLEDDPQRVLQEATGASWAARVGEKSVSYGRYLEDEETKPPLPKNGLSISKQTQKDSSFTHDVIQTTLDAIRAQMLIRVYRVRGHLSAQLDPLGLATRAMHPELDPATYGFSPQDYKRIIYLGGSLNKEKATLAEILTTLQDTYCRSIGVEFMHIQDPDQKTWIQMQMENHDYALSDTERRQALEGLVKAEDFEKFLAAKYPGAKRFGLEGSESLIPLLQIILEESARRGVFEVIMGMSHRGRLNVLGNIIEQPYASIFSKFQDSSLSESPEVRQGSGDVKYHLGAEGENILAGHKVHISLTANPSHLESVNPVVIGKTRARQNRLKDDTRSKVLSLLLHGDAAFSGQGLVAETLGMSELCGYRVGGTIHVIINNQIGFTTSPAASRSSPYCSDVVKGIQAPVFHVNGDDVEAVIRVAHLAAEFRARFKKDVVIDLYCYRRYGHNEIDDPSFTQPVMYAKIRSHPSVRQLYEKSLIDRKILTAEKAQEMAADFHEILQKNFEKSHTREGSPIEKGKGRNSDSQPERSGVNLKDAEKTSCVTGVSDPVLKTVGKALVTYPKSFDIHKRLAKTVEARASALEEGKGIDWATAEALAFGSLLLEGYRVRLSGQDSGRGTFSQRHAVFYDQQNGAPYVPLNNIEKGQREIEVIDSPLAEASVLGFELGYSLADPDTLVLWEAQFGDFANGAQVIIDQYIASGEMKWGDRTGLVLLLPHGYEGQGPEHSSARLERYLQLCAEENMIVANCTTPANYFHVLRRQLHLESRPLNLKIRKPLILFTPKSLLRHKRAVSSLQEFTDSTAFQAVIVENDKSIKAQEIQRVIFCSGKVYYDLLEEREKMGISNVVLVRVEQLYPFPEKDIVACLKLYPLADVVWCQEEPQNMGAWNYIAPRLGQAMEGIGAIDPRKLLYAGRPSAAATATGWAFMHEEQQKFLLEKALKTQATLEVPKKAKKHN